MFRRKNAWIWGIVMVLFLSACGEGSEKYVSYALKQEGKVYLYSPMGKMITESSLESGSAPGLLSQTGFVVERGTYYINPSSLGPVVNILSGNVEVIEHQEKSYDGYIVEGEKEVFEIQYKQESTETIGVMESSAEATLTHPESGKQRIISWVSAPEPAALKNCQEVKITVVHNPSPGETVYNRRKRVLIPLEDLVHFFDPATTIEYDGKSEVVYFIQ